MSNSILNLSLMGLNVAQSNISTTSNNISNVNTAGYHRESTTVATVGSQSVGSGFIGMGANVTDVVRAYNSFLENQVTQNQGQLSNYQAYSQYATQLNALLGGQNSGLSSALSDFFSSIQTVSTDPTSTVARQAMLGAGANLATQFNNVNDGLNSLSDAVNQQVQASATQINAYAQSIASLNKQILTMQSSAGGSNVNSLMDQRDATVAELNKLVNVTVSDQQGSGYIVTIGNGLPLVNGTQANTMTVAPNPTDPVATLPALQIGSSTIALDSSQITGGQLGGILAFRDQMLNPSLTQMGLLASAVTTNINTQQAAGFDLNGAAGGNFFTPLTTSLPTMSVAGTGAATITAGLSNANKLASTSYTLSYNGTKYTLTDSSGNLVDQTTLSPVPSSNWSSFGAPAGLSLSASAPFTSGDSYLITASPLRVPDMSLDTTSSGMGNPPDPNKIAAASTATALNDNSNLLAMANFQTSKLLGNSSLTLQGAFTSLVSQDATLESRASNNQKTFQSLTDQATQAQQSYSGVNLDEEAANLIRYQQAYQAAAKAMQVASTLFNNILTAIQ